MTAEGGVRRAGGREVISGPLTSTQQRMWLLEEMGLGWPAYMIDYALRLHGDVDLGSLKYALGIVFQNHEALRTRYRRVGDDLEQVVIREDLLVREADFVPDNSVPLTDQLWSVARAARRPLDGAEPCFIVQLLRIAPDDLIVLMSAPHLSLDLRSLRIIQDEFCAIYQAACSGDQLPPRAQATRYLRYAVEQLDRRQARTSDESYWCERLDGVRRLAFPADFPRPPRWSGAGDSVEARLPTLVAETLRFLGRRHGASPFMAFLAVCMAGIARFTGQNDIAVGIPLSGRTEPWSEDVVGCFVETVVVRADVSPDSSYLQILSDVRDAVLGGMEHPSLPFAKIIALSGGRDPSTHPVYQAMVAYEEPEKSAPSMSGLHLEEVPTGSQAAKVDISCHLAEMADGSLVISVNYATALFKRGTVEAFAGRLAALARSIARSPDLPIAEHARPAAEAAGPRSAGSGEPGGTVVPVHESVGKFAADDPGKLAFLGDADQITYGELEAAAALLATRLVRYADRAEAVVGICVERRLHAVIAVLGTMKAGLSFLLLDAREPISRLQPAIERGGVSVVVADRSAMAPLRELGVDILGCAGGVAQSAVSGRLHRYPPSDGSLACLVEADRADDVTASQLLAISRTALHGRILRQSLALALEPGARVLVDAPVIAAGGLAATLGALLAEATVVTSDDSTLGDPSRLAALFERHAVTAVYLDSAAALDRFVGSGVLARCGAVRSVCTGSDPVPAAMLRSFDRQTAVGLRGTVGDGGCCVHVGVCTGERHVRAGARVVDVGAPGDRVLVLDDRFFLAAPGEIGSLHVSGPSLASGFVGNSALTAERFRPDPFSDRPGSRMYDTGCVGRWTPDGALEILGTRNRRLRVQGTLVNLSEIEAVLAEHPSVWHAHVTARVVASGDHELSVSVTAAPDGLLVSAEEILAFLNARLPRPMVARNIEVTCGSWLPTDADAGSGVRVRTAAAKDEPDAGNDLALLVAEVWRECLAIDEVSPATDFFWAGGHSLVAAQIAVRLSTLLPGARIPAMALFDVPGFADFVQLVERSVLETAEHAN